MARVTLKTIAIKTGYSITTVSRALAGYSDVSPATREKIVAVAEELGYYPNLTARQLQKQRTDTVGIILPTFGPRFADPYFSEIIAGIGDELAQQGYDLLISTCPPGPGELAAYRHKVEGGRVDGLIVIRTRRQDQRIAYLAQTSFPFVAFGRTDLDLDFPYIDEDGEAGSYELTRHLISLGHQRIGYISAPPDLMFAHFRLQGYRHALTDAKLPYDEQVVVYGDLTRRGGAQVARRLLSLTPRPTALIAANDLMALGAIAVAREAGLEIGRDLSIAGFDDIPPAEITSLTTLRQPIYEIGRRLSQMICALIRGQTLEQSHVLLKPKLLVRASSGPPLHT
ncbi:MAG TPA: LacI family transcriptional regulator [Chloroflexi bacterium]|nr:LacI family transcriptional regulator [Chloroflexota bacterium]